MKILTMILGALCIFVCAHTAMATNMDMPKLARDDDAFLEEIQRQAFKYFWDEANPDTGIVYDGNSKRMGGSIASVGFALSAICVADSRGWVSREDAYNRVLATIKSFHRNPDDPGDFCVDGHCGLFFHFIDTRTGKWYKNADCVSTADTADLMAGIITCMEYFKGTEIERLGDEIVRACEWDSFLKDNKGAGSKFIAMGCVPPGMKSTWTEEKGFFGRYYGYMDNSFIIYLLALASPTYPIPATSWYACQSTYKRQTYNNKTVIVTTPPGLAFHYYQHCWVDLRNRKDQVADYFHNSLLAVVAQQEYCLQSDNYKDGLWGISSSLSPRGYEAMGAPFGDAYENGTITPHAIAGGMVFTPKRSLDALEHLAANYGDMTMGRYGFTDAFNQKKMWSSREYIGIDQGVLVLMIENFRTGLVRDYFMRNKYIQDALRKIGFVGIVEDFENDPGGNAYSSYALVGNNAVFAVSEAAAMEGKRSLRIDRIDGDKITLKIKPDLSDFSGFRFVSLWARNSRDMKLLVRDKRGAAVTLDYDCYLESAGWRRYFYNLNKAGELSLKNIAEMTITIIPANDDRPDSVYIDGIFLTYAMVNSNPSRVSGIKLLPITGASICYISFDAATGAHRYDIRYSERPILTQDEFERCPAIGAIYFASGAEREEFFVPLPKGGKYYMAVQTVDYMGQRSGPVPAGSVEITGNSPSVVLDDFERSTLPSKTIGWPSHSSYQYTITNKHVSHGKRALKVDYDKVPSNVWDFVELAFKKPLDVRPFRYLKMDVLGDDAVIAKLYNSKDSQEEIGTLRGLKKGHWNELVFDMGAMPADKIDKRRITKLLLFIAPGRSASGTMYIDNIRLEN